MQAELELDVEPLLERRQAQLLEPRPLGLGELLVGELLERRAAPERQGVAERLGGAGLVVLAHAPGLVDQRLEAAQVELPGRRREHVAAGPRDELARPPRRLTAGASALRSCDTYTVSSLRALAGGSPDHSSSTSRSLETTSFACRSSRASSARCFGASIRNGRPRRRASSGPRIRNSSVESVPGVARC